ncbi:threonine synthase [Acidipropionibacterium acidipropionici]|uniref:threonine synthase n=1 Tax=Acidipropionibacterium acidipropionici TaxID=1748 RepID=UPI000403BE97|nr:threonine synthase [Acidipropionibacterium acidipropionici]ALN15957.1 threonine synthase [Acidipropionibacterium acidipropionici]APZ08295.1 threonine synthase [Acidipropionibacterium acidipropionici]MDN6557508.1 threonine synthase [Acidipropionibacterium acidipropionici]
MRYLSTRGLPEGPRPGFSEILLEGLAPDGGLYMPETYPQVDAATLASWRSTLAADGYAGLAASVLSLFIDDIDAADLRRLCDEAYSDEVFSSPLIAPVDELDGGLWLAHLSGGPTAAFKDMAMQLLGRLFEFELNRRGRELTILGATSGDTGSAAEYAMLGRRGIRVFMLTPAGRMTPFQQAQMFSLDDPSIVNIAVDGVFDDCQDLVKELFSDLEFRRRHHLGAVNSINWARLAAQVVYYISSWLRATTSDDQEVSFAVPTGNFGDIMAGHVARMMGVPIRTLVLATNENNVLDEFFRTGVYRVRGAAETLATSSPSMDISKASNFERFIFDLLGRDSALIRDLFGAQLPSQGSFDVSGTSEFSSIPSRYGFVSGSSRHADRLATISQVLERDGVLIDPHTADAVTVARRHVEPGIPMIVLETALPVKFAATIAEATGRVPERPSRFEGLEELPRHVIDLPDDAGALRALIAGRS